MTSLVITNSSIIYLSFVHLNFNHGIGDHLRNFKHLSFINIGQVIVVVDPYDSPVCLPSNLIFQNLRHISHFKFPRFDKKCEERDLTLKSLVLKNVTVPSLAENFISRQNLWRLEMEDVFIREARKNSFRLINDNGVVKISRSVVDIAHADVMEFNVSEVSSFFWATLQGRSTDN